MAFTTPDTHITGYVISQSDWNQLVNNDNAINSMFRQNIWPDYEAHAITGLPVAPATSVTSATGDTYKPEIPILTFIGTSDQGRGFTCRWPRGYGVSATLVGSYYMTGVNSDDDAILEAYMTAVSSGLVSRTAIGFDSVNQVAERVPDAIGTEGDFAIVLTNNDTVVANDWTEILLVRNGDDGSDTANVGLLALTSLAVDFDLAT
ncbi:MAG: hypothetical protein JRD89_14535 [Deltaproteobacteria bacterium]|nr:hypothetical protein [Deltaproteobacteria bacterium]